MSAYIIQERHASTKFQYQPLSVKHTFPLSVLSFPWLRVSAVSLLSKKGLRYLLYPFISLWMVGGRISPSFTSALSNELSNNLRAKTEKKKEPERERGAEIRIIILPLCIYLVDSSSRPPPYSHNPQGVDWALQRVVQTTLRQRKLKWQLGAKKQEEREEKRCFASFNN